MSRAGLLGWRPRSLATRILIPFLLLLLGVQGVAFFVVRWSIDDNAHRLLAQDLQVGERVWARLLEQRAQRLTLGASLLAADYGFRAALASSDTETLRSALANHGARIGATASAMLSSDLQPLAVSEGADEAAVQRVLASLRAQGVQGGEPGSTPGAVLALHEGRPYQFVLAPVRAPLLLGYVAMGFELDAGLLADLRAVTGLQAALVVGAAGGGGERVLHSTLAPEQADELLTRPLQGAQRDEIALAGQAHVCRSIQQVGDQAALQRASSPMPGGGSLRTVLLRSVDEAVAPYQRLQATLAAITLGGLLLAGAAGVFTARRVTTPLGDLVLASGRLARGDYAQPLQDGGRGDEVGELARAFDHMRQSIAAHQADIHQLAYWDRLTGLPNRARFAEAVSQAIAQGADAGRPVAVVMLDLDRFKHVNDVLGYAFGDRLLRAVAERLVGQAVRDGDLVARLAGDRFALLLPGSNAGQALAVAERVSDAFQLPLTLDEHTVDLAAGFGVAAFPEHATEADALISHAEVAMYAAKRSGGGAQARVYDPAADAASATTLSLLTELRRAIEQDELRLFLQPKLALADGRIGGAEALLRWQHPQRGLVPPAQFIPFAEQTGFVRRLTMWVFEAAARQWDTLSALGLQRIAVNLSTRDLLDQELPAKLERILARHGVPAQAFCLEITESAIMDEPQRAEATLNQLAAAGFKLSIDDFGTGYSSLAYLKRLPVQELKIDRSFVIGMATDPGDATIVRSTIELAHNLGLSTVAEGVEDAPTLQRLAEMGCDEAQGYHLSRPLPVAEFALFAARHARQAGAGQAPVPATTLLH